MTRYVRTCPYCGSENTEIEEETYDYFADDIHIMYNMKCNDCGEGFVGEDDFILINSATGQDPDDLWKELNRRWKDDKGVCDNAGHHTD